MNTSLDFCRIIRNVARAYPDKIAAVCGDRRVTYAELNHSTDKVAHALARRGVKRETIVGVFMERSVEFLTAMLGILKAGAAYMPIDSEYPSKRIAYMLQKSGCATILVSSDAAGERLARVTTAESLPARVLAMAELEADQHAPASDFAYTSDLLSYVMFTSGSTGAPKGVMNLRRGLNNHLHAKIRDLEITQRDRVAQTASQCFDISIWQFLSALLVGGQVHIVRDEVVREPAKLLAYLGDQGISVVQFVPSLLKLLVNEVESRPDAARPLRSLRWVALVGEALSADLCRRWFKHYPEVPLLNHYGPTECADGVTHFKVTPELARSAKSIPIGKALPNTRVYICKQAGGALTECATEEVGELYISGIGVGRGYINDAEKTSASFLPNPFSREEPYTSLYKTGDLACYNAEGNLEFFGRADRQVKIRGFRVELEEIEALLLGYPGVKGCAVIGKASRQDQSKLVARECVARAAEPEPNITYLIAYVVAGEPISQHELRRHLMESVPDYMVPERFVQLPELPLNANGKLDVNALPAPDRARPMLAHAYVPPQTATERSVVEAWQAVLAIDRVGITDTYFELGGDSLTAMQIINRLEAALQVKVSYQDVFTLDVAGLARRIEAGKASPPEAAEEPSGAAAPPPSPGQLHPLSLEQQRLWFLWKLMPDNAFYTLQGRVIVSGHLDAGRLQRAWEVLFGRHQALRARFVDQGGVPRQIFEERRGPELQFADLTALSDDARTREIERARRLEIARPFDLEREPLLRLRLFKVQPDRHVLLLTTHEIIMDAWSLSTLMRDLKNAYARPSEETSRGAALALSFAEFLYQEERSVRPDKLTKERAYWSKHLEGKLPVLDLPRRGSRARTPGHRGDSVGVLLSTELSHKLRRTARENQVTLFMCLLSSFYALLSRYSGQNDIVIGTPHVNRSFPGGESLVGFFLNMLPIRLRSSEEQSFKSLLDSTRESVVGAFTHSKYPFLWTAEWADTARDSALAPVFQVMFNMYSERAEAMTRAQAEGTSGIELSFQELETGFTKYELTLYAQEQGDRIYLQLSYFIDLFEKQFVEDMLANLVTLLNGVTERIDAPLAEHDIVAQGQRQRLLSGASIARERRSYDVGTHSLFEAQVDRSPGAVAYLFQDRSMSYAELNRRVNQLAHFMIRRGVRRGTRVGIALRRSLEVVISILACVKVGATYVPLDLDYPAARLRFILEDSGAEFLVSAGPAGALGGRELVNLDLVACRDRIDREPTANLAPCAEAEDITNIVYTSSSTGKPKGVLIPQRAILNRLHWMWSEYPFNEHDVALLQKSYALVAASWELFGALLKGRPTVAITRDELTDPSKLYALLCDRKITYLLATPSILEGVVQRAQALGATSACALRLATTSAEPLSPGLVKRWYATFPRVPLLNLYGSTECSSNVTAYDTRELPAGATNVPIGRTLPNNRVYVLNSRLKLVPEGVIGEMCIAGDCLARGYQNLSELTATQFVQNPYEPGQTLFRSGDLVRCLPGGNLELAGRRDFQLKIRGFRIEPAEVEVALKEHPHVKDAVVAADGETDAERELVAYFVPASGPQADEARALSYGQLRNHLRGSLPDYMVPCRYVVVDEIPLTANGKLDRIALTSLGRELARDVEYIAPATETEVALAQIWEGALRKPRIGTADNFFDLGGHSLMATQIIAKVFERFHVELPLLKIFECPTVLSLAAQIDVLRGEARSSTDRSRSIKASQEKITGEVALGAYQAWYLRVSGSRIAPARWNLSRLWKVEKHIRPEDLRVILSLIVDHHDSLRATFHWRDGEWRQLLRDGFEPLPFVSLDLSGLSRAALLSEMRAAAEREQRRFDISSGPLFCFLHFRHEGGDYLLIIAHHLIVDGTSMAILVQDIELLAAQLLAGEPYELPAKTVSYKQWAGLLNEHARGALLEAERGYWLTLPWEEVPLLPTDHPDSRHRNTYRSSASISAALGEEDTQTLLYDLPRDTAIEVIHVLLLCLTQTIAGWTGEPWVEFISVDNGRDYLPDYRFLDLGRSVGWFSACSVLVLRRTEASELGIPHVREFAERLAQVPNRGRGFFPLVELSGDPSMVETLKPRQKDEIVFNYRGRIDLLDVKDSLFKPTQQLELSAQHPDNTHFNNKLNVSGVVAQGRLTMQWEYSSNVHTRATISGLAERFQAHVKQIVQSYRSGRPGAAAPAKAFQ
ncbi:amino acid adenylation domain-containing protein [Sorangium sp. So ce1128]